MTNSELNPPRWAYTFLKLSLRPSDADAVPGDLLEEYREARRPALGQRWADAWYIVQVASVFWRVMWPGIVAMALMKAAAAVLPAEWNSSPLPVPGVSWLDALTLLWTGYYSSRRTGRLITGIVTSTLASLFGFTTFFVDAAVSTPSLVAAPFEKPFIFVILSILLVGTLAFGATAGALGGAVGRRRVGTTISPSHA